MLQNGSDELYLQDLYDKIQCNAEMLQHRLPQISFVKLL